MPKVSVIMSVYNGERFLKEAVASILAQTFSDFEFIIINDGSTDTTSTILHSYTDSRIKLIERDNQGLIHSLNQALDLAQGEYLARMDADDISLPRRLEKQIAFLGENEDIGIVGSWAEVIDEAGIKTTSYEYPPLTDQEIKCYLIKHNAFIHPSVMLRRSLLINNKYRNFKHIEDYELWTRLLQKTQGANLPEELLKYRVLDSSITRKNRTQIRLRGLWVRCLVLIRLYLHLPI